MCNVSSVHFRIIEMQMYIVSCRLGQALVNTQTLEKAKEYFEQQRGQRNGPCKVAPASKYDEGWVKSMGSIVREAKEIEK